MKTAAPWKYSLLLAHAGLLIAAITAGRWLYDGAFGQGDVLAVINPCPQVTIADNIAHYPVNPYPQIQPRSGHVASNPFVYVWDWYAGMNGRVSTAIMDSFIALAAKKWCPTPESFPWWLMRSLSMYCLLAAALNFLYAVGWIWARRPGMTIVLLAAVWSIWALSPGVYVFSAMYDILLTDRNIHTYALSWMVIGAIRNWPAKSAWRWGIMAAGVLFLAADLYLFSTPVLLIAAAGLGLVNKPEMARDWLRQAFYYGAFAALAAFVFFMSPGQWAKNTFVPIIPPGDFSPAAWFRRAVDVGYGTIFPKLSDSPWIWHLIIYAGLGLIMTAWIIIRIRRKSPGPSTAEDFDRQKLFGIGLMAFAFLTAFLASMTTMIVSSYFPPYAVSYPSLLLAIGLALSFWFVLGVIFPLLRMAVPAARLPRLAGAAGKAVNCGPFILAALAAFLLFGKVTARFWPAVTDGHRRIMAQNLLRKQLYAEMLQIRNTTGQRHFILTNLWTSPVWGLHIDQIWSRAGYFRWLGMEDVVSLTEGEWNDAGRPQEEMYFRIDCAEKIKRDQPLEPVIHD
ncbi:MAG: hypothetical protein PHP98_02135 [Kiritimatiellae bacterium]|nr:hypothetical protein [Kiritimatiellia bacterium]